jgi:succinate dehydrogenase / fumarate reductase, membrane anchor subunit
MIMPPSHRDRSRWAWLVQAISGGLLLVLLGLHMVANHFIVQGGIRTYADVVRYLGNPIVLPLELLFLVTVTVHALLGVRAVILDLGIGPRAVQRLDFTLVVLGGISIGYGFWLTARIMTGGAG